MIFFHTKFRMLLDWTASRIQFHQTNLTNVAKFLMLQIFLNIRHKLFEFQTFMNQTQSINSTDIIIYFTDTYYLYHEKMSLSENVVFRGLRLSLCHFGQQVPESPVLCLSSKMVYQHLLYLLLLWTYRHLKFTQGPTHFFNGNFRGC